MKRQLLFTAFVIIVLSAHAQLGPEVTSWIINTTGATGYGNIPSNVQEVQYTDSNVYVSSTCIPGYDIGPWTGNPNVPANQNFVFKITRHPRQNTGTATNTPLGHIGVWTNGVSLFNAKDARSYNNAGVWNQNAIIVEGPSFDACLGHPQQNGEYHLHLNPTCLYDDNDFYHHSPIIGYAFDGFPIYGTYGYANTDGTGGIKRILSSYRKRNISTRDTMPDGTVLQSSQYGPAISNQYPLGYYIEDFEFVPQLGDLDQHNGRFCVTPEYPNGTYAYFVTLDTLGNPAYPYTLGLTYYGVVQSGNTGPQSAHNVAPNTAVTYLPDTTTGINETNIAASISVYPNPAQNDFGIYISGYSFHQPTLAEIFDGQGRKVFEQRIIAEFTPVENAFANGIYLVKLTGDKLQRTEKLVIQR